MKVNLDFFDFSMYFCCFLAALIQKLSPLQIEKRLHVLHKTSSSFLEVPSTFLKTCWKIMPFNGSSGNLHHFMVVILGLLLSSLLCVGLYWFNYCIKICYYIVSSVPIYNKVYGISKICILGFVLLKELNKS